MEYKKNQDGTDFLDENGNKVPIEITDKEKEAAKEKENLVKEIQDLRLKLGITEKLLEQKKEDENKPDPNTPLTDEQKLDALLDVKLKERDALNAKANKTAAFEKFIAENKEFSSENDPTGLKRNALLEKINRFNTDGLTKIEEFLSVIGEAKTLLLGNDSSVDITRDRNPLPNPPKSPNNPPGKPDEVLSPKELKLAQQTGKTKEQILKLKLKNPEYLSGLLEYVRD